MTEDEVVFYQQSGEFASAYRRDARAGLKGRGSPEKQDLSLITARIISEIADSLLFNSLIARPQQAAVLRGVVLGGDESSVPIGGQVIEARRGRGRNTPSCRPLWAGRTVSDRVARLLN